MWLTIVLAVIWGTVLVAWIISLFRQSPEIRYKEHGEEISSILRTSSGDR
jgi:hypothetical protein